MAAPSVFLAVQSLSAIAAETTTTPAGLDSLQLQQLDEKESPDLGTPCKDEWEMRRIAIFEREASSVVYIDTFTEQASTFSTDVEEVPLGAGSGFIWDNQGHIVTNLHVIRNAKKAQIAILAKIVPDQERIAAKKILFPSTSQLDRREKRSFIEEDDDDNNDLSLYTSMRQPGPETDYTRKVYKGRVVGIDPNKDIAVLKVDAPEYDLHPIQVGTSKGLKVGQAALAIGNPFGLDHTLSAGVISGIGREVRSPNGRPITNVIQTDAAVNPGNSGGPLLDAMGRLIGMNTAIYSPSGASAGIAFAIPVDALKNVVETLIRDGKIVRPVLGITYLQSKQARALGVQKGVLVLDVTTSSPAYRAGIRGTRRSESGLIDIGDVIIKIDDFMVDTEADLLQALESFQPGDRVKITVHRADTSGGEVKMKKVVLFTQLKASNDSSSIFF